jgi:hypothetical protein
MHERDFIHKHNPSFFYVILYYICDQLPHRLNNIHKKTVKKSGIKWNVNTNQINQSDKHNIHQWQKISKRKKVRLIDKESETVQ